MTRFVTRYLRANTPDFRPVDEGYPVGRMRIFPERKLANRVARALRKNRGSLTTGIGIADYDSGITQTS